METNLNTATSHLNGRKRAVEQIFQGVSIHGDIQNVPERYPWQPTLDDPA